MKLIPLLHGKFAKVDDSEYERLMQFRWTLGTSGSKTVYYAFRREWTRVHKRKYKSKRIPMQNEAMGLSNDLLIDHRDGDGLNNQCDNLRIATHQQNAANRRVCKNNKLGIKGVSFHKGKFRATIMNEGRCIHLGYFDTPENASRRYLEAATEIHGEFARA